MESNFGEVSDFCPCTGIFLKSEAGVSVIAFIRRTREQIRC
jgi:hypothetical protein